MMKQCYLVLTGVLILSIFTGFFGLDAEAGENPILYFFWGEGCGYCEKERVFLLEDFRGRHPEVEMRFFETWKDQDGRELATAMRQALKIERASVPLTVIGDWYTIGFGGAERTGRKIEEQIQLALKGGPQDSLELLGPHRLVAKVRSEAVRNDPRGWKLYPAAEEGKE